MTPYDETKTYPYNLGLLEGAIKCALIELKYNGAGVGNILESALARVEANLARRSVFSCELEVAAHCNDFYIDVVKQRKNEK